MKRRVRTPWMALLLVAGACEPPSYETLEDCEAWRPGAVVLTELLADPDGVDTGQEWVELYNPGRDEVDLNGLLFYVARTDGSQEKAYLFEESVPVEAGGHGVLGSASPGPLPALGNSGGLIGLRCGDVIVDEVRYTGSTRGVARMYDGRFGPDAVDNDEEGRWCDAPASDGGTRGSPGAVNPPCASPPGGTDGGDAGVPEDTCLVPGTGARRSLNPPGPGDLVLTEFMADPKAVADTQGEWVELYALRDVDLNGVTLANEGSGRATFEDARCLEVRRGTQAVLARGADQATNGGLPPVLGTFTFNLGNSAGTRALRLSWRGVLLDEVTWTSAALPGVSQQLDPSRKDATRNDEPGSFCPTPEGSLYGLGDRGTPGRENHPCTP